MQETNGDDNNNGLMLVGIGASAGGVEALLSFFEHTPADSGLAYAVLLHTAPDHESRLADVLQTKTAMPVTQVAGSVRVEPNRVYCIPPDSRLSMADGHFRLEESEMTDGGRHAPIDLFFRVLASAYKDKAIAVVLSGAGADGSLGLGSVREEGGVSLAQEPSEAGHAAMPRSAIQTGWVDFVLPVASIPEKLVSLRQNAERIQLPPAEPRASNIDEDALRELLALLRARTRHDFANYKRSTMLRRIERRLQVTESEDIHAYLRHIRKNPDELHALLRDLLISVTNFFRDPEAFQRLESEIVPRLFEGKDGSDQIRIWVSGCATGEEAYSIAMLLSEHAESLTNRPALQVFATDIDEEALSHGRGGVYPATIKADVSPERLKRFFVKEGLYYRVKRELREAVLFAPHNILRDPPFSKLDLVSCRNLLIYINRQMQERILEIFHFSLKPGGHLFLGSSESADGLTGLFTPVDKKHRIFKRRKELGGQRVAPVMPEHGNWQVRPATIPQAVMPGTPTQNFSFGELHYRMLEAFAPPSVLVNADYDIVHLSENVGHFLRFSGGDPSRNLLKSVHPDLRLELHSLLITAPQQGGVSRSVPAVLDGKQTQVRVTVRPVSAPRVSPGFLLVVFEAQGGEEEAEPDEAARAGGPVTEPDGLELVVRQMEGELERTRDRLRSTIEEYETSVEELKASNEELQAMNEELRSAGEELETGKEEMQSVNEELTTLNSELREKVEEVSRANSDIQNLLASTHIATLFLDRFLRVKRYTPSAQELFNIIPGDIGRPLGHVTHHLDYEGLARDAEWVLNDLMTVEREVATTGGRHFIMRLTPYRTTDDKISGVVITFTDITERKRAEEALRRSEERIQRVLETDAVGVIFFDHAGTVIDANHVFLEMTGYTRADVEAGALTWQRLTPPEFAGESEEQMAQMAATGRIGPYEKEYILKDGSRRWMLFAGRDLGDGTISEYCIDVTDRRRVEDALRASEERLRLVVETAQDYAIMLMDDEGRYTSWNSGAEKIFGYREEEVKGRKADIIFTPEDRAAGVPAQELRTAERDGRANDERWHMRRDGERFYCSGVMVALRHGRGYAKIARDLTAQKRAQDELQHAWEDLDRRVGERTAELASANSAMREEARVRRLAERERTELLRRIVTTQEEERRRISRELHDQLGQSLTALRLKLEALDGEAGKRSKLHGRIAELTEIAKRLDTDVDFLAWELRPTALDDLGLIAALSTYATEWSKHFGVKVNFHSAGLGDARLALLAETNLYRIAQEALNNVAKHADAASVDMLLERRNDHVVLIVEDNGRGFDPDGVKAEGGERGMGLVGMRERAALVGGTVELESRPGEGTTVFVRVPVRFGPTDALGEGEGQA